MAKTPKPAEKTKLRIVAHSSLLYWWPVWLLGFVASAMTALSGHEVALPSGPEIHLSRSPSMGFAFMALIALTAAVSTVRLKGLRSVILLLVLALILIVMAWAGWLGDLARLVPAFAVHVSAGAFFVLSSLLFAVWALQILVLDRLSYWEISAGQLVRKRVIGAAEEAFDARGMIVEHEADDFIRHIVFGLGSGDIYLHTAGADRQSIHLQNVILVDRKVDQAHRLVGIEPTT